MAKRGAIDGRIVKQEAIDKLNEIKDVLDQAIGKAGEFEKATRKATGVGGLTKLEKAQKNYNETLEQTVSGKIDEIALLQEDVRLSRTLAREKAKNAKANSATAKAINDIRNARKADLQAQRREEAQTKKLSTAYGRLVDDVNNLQKEYKELAASQKLNTARGREVTKSLQEQGQRLNKINAAAGDFRNNVGNYSSALRPAISAVRQLVGAFGIIEGLRFAFNFASEAADLARQAKGVEFAFQSLGQEGVNAFRDIKASTKGLLSDLEIKTSINELANFNIDLEQAGVLFEFLAVRSAQTGQSVDKLKDSLVEGLSKESLLRIDNLGISAGELNKELEKTPNFVQAVANIARTEIAEAGNILDDTANASERLNASIENFKLSVGNSFSNIPGLDFLADQFNRISEANQALNIRLENLGQELGIVDRLIFNVTAELASYTKAGREANRQLIAETENRRAVAKSVQDQINSYVALAGSLAPLTQEQLKGLGLPDDLVSTDQLANLNEINEAIKSKTELLNKTNIQDKRAIATIRDQIKALEEQRNSILGIGEATKAVEGLGKEFGKEFVNGITNGLVSLNEIDDIQKFFNEVFEGQTLEANIGTPELEGLGEAAQRTADELRKANEEANGVKNAVRDSALAITGELEKELGVSFQFINDVIEGTKAEFSDFLALTGGLTQQILQNNSANYENEIAQNREKLNTILADERLSEEQKRRAREVTARREAALRKKQAQQAKRNALFEIALNTAIAVSKTLATPLKIPAVIALGAAQAALVAAQPIPEFFRGKNTLNNYEGPGTVNELPGQREYGMDKQGNITQFPAGKHLRHIGRDELIFPSKSNLERQAANPRSEAFKRLNRQLRDDTSLRKQLDLDRLEKVMTKGISKAKIVVNANVIMNNKKGYF